MLPQNKVGDIEQGLPRAAVAHPAARIAADLVVLRKTGAQQRNAEAPGALHAVRVGYQQLRARRAGLPAAADEAERLAHVDPEAVALEELPPGSVADLDGVRRLADAEGEAPAAEGVTTAVTGVVFDAATGGPVAGARVALFSAFYQPHLFYDRQLGELGGGATDVTGRFRFAAVNLDDLHFRGGAGLLLVITHPTIASWTGPPVVPLVEGTVNDLGTFRCDPVGFTLGGQVRHREGRPLPGLLVTVSPDNPVNVAKPERQVLLKSLPHAVTDGDGRWRIDGLRPGKAWLSVHAGLDGVLFQAITVAESRDDVNVSVRVGGQVTGRVIDRAGRPIPAARIDGSGNTTHSLADGTFLLENLDSPDPFTLHVTHHAYYPRDVAQVQDGARDLEILLEPLPVATLVVRQGADVAPCTECEIVYEGPPAALARIPTSPYRRSADGAYDVILYPEITWVRVFRVGFAERRLAASVLAGGTRTEVALEAAGG